MMRRLSKREKLKNKLKKKFWYKEHKKKRGRKDLLSKKPITSTTKDS